MSTTLGHLAHNLESSLLDLSPQDSIHSCGSAATLILPSNPQAVIDLAHRKLHAYPFKDVPLCWRRAYEEACLWKILWLLKELTIRNEGEGEGEGETQRPDWVRDVVEICDMALILTGAPVRRDVIDGILAAIDETEVPASKRKDILERNGSGEIFGAAEEDNEYLSDSDNASQRPAKRLRLSRYASTSTSSNLSSTQLKSLSKIANPKSRLNFVTPITLVPLVSQPLCQLNNPSLVAFNNHLHKSRTPLILTNTLGHWPALKLWQNPEYWLKRTHGGRRLVPVELGRSYTDEGWGQRIMCFGEYLKKYLTENESASERQDGENGEKGYLAQHDLLTQIPALRRDIMIPEYCYLDTPSLQSVSTPSSAPAKSAISSTPTYPTPQTSNQHPPSTTASPTSGHEPASDDDFDPATTEPLMNIWLGPASTISPAHTDPHHNILCQVFGRKYIRLFAPSQSDKMYPMRNGKSDQSSAVSDEAVDDGNPSSEGVDMGNTSSVDVSLFLDFPASITTPRSTSASLSHIHDIPSGLARSEPAAHLEAQRHAQRTRFPLFETAEYVDAILEPGDAVYIPRGWWHYVQSLSVGCSVSFWWD